MKRTRLLKSNENWPNGAIPYGNTNVSIRMQRVAAEIQKALAGPLQRIAEKMSASFITVTEVRMSPDLQLARVYLSVCGGKPTSGEVLEHIERDEAGRLRFHVGKTVRLRYVPQLKFYIDDSLDRAMRINAILDSVKPKDEDNPDSMKPQDDEHPDSMKLQDDDNRDSH